MLRRLVIKRVFTEHEIDKAYNLAGACVGMLTKAIIAVERTSLVPPRVAGKRSADPI